MRKQILPSQQSGFTLVELLVVLSIAAIIVSIAAPSFMNIIANNRVTAASNELVVALNLGKNEAVRSGQRTRLCKSQNGNQCDNSANWKDGWLLFQDNDDNGSVNGAERIIRVHSAPHASLDFEYPSGNSVVFRPDGRILINANSHFCFRNSYNDDKSKAVVITMVGRIRTEDRNYDCV